MEKPLAGTTVVDVSSYVTAGFATMMLANQGAEVVKIERPGTGDPHRGSGPPFVEGESAYFMTSNYGKRSLTVDLKTEEGRDIVRDLAADADVFVENLRPGKIDDLGLGYDDLSAENPGLVYCAISAFGETGPWSDRAGFDVMMQGWTGVMSVTGEADGPPAKVGLPFSDVVTALWAAFGIVNALHRRERTGEGDYVELGMFESVLPLLTKQLGKAFEGEVPQRMGTRDPVLAPYQAYEASDGYIVVGIGTDPLWETFCAAIDRPDLADDERFTTNADRVVHVDELERELEATLAERSVDEWVETLVEEYGIPAGPVWTVNQALDSEQLAARDAITEHEHSAVGPYPVLDHPIRYRNAAHGFDGHAPVLGEHTDAILERRGYSPEEIAALRERGVIGDRPTADTDGS